MSKIGTLVCFVAMVWASNGAAVAAEPSADDALATYFKANLEECFRMRPMDATSLGDHRFDALLDDISQKARAGWVAHTRKTLAELPRRVAFDKLSPAAKIDYRIFERELAKDIWAAENLRPFEEDPRVYSGYISDSVFALLAQSTAPKETNIANAIARMKQIPKVVAAARANLARPPKAHTETAIGQNRGAIAFYESGLFEIVGPTPQLEELKAAAQSVVECLKGYQKFLEEELLPRADGQWRLGKEKFAKKLEMTLDAGLTADDVLAEAEREFVRVENDMAVIARQLWGTCYPGKPIPPDDAEGRHAMIAQVLHAISQDHSTSKTLLADTRATVAGVKRFIADRKILALPEPDRCQVIEMPEFQRGNSTAYMNSAPPLDPKAVSMYAVSPPPKDWDAAKVKSFFEEYNCHMLQILTIHEAYPGHYVQGEYANRNSSLLRRVLGSGVYVEGWAVYTEQMMLDQGYGEGNLPLRLTQLKFYLRTVANAILDNRMHCAAMTDDEAMGLLSGRAFQSEGEARLKVIRAKQSSCQLSTYFVGRTAMMRLRQVVQRELGEKFDLARYHEAVLDAGPVPVKFLPEIVRQTLR